MKKKVLKIIILIVALSQSLSCKTLKSVPSNTIDNFIPYLLPIETEKAIYTNIQPLLADDSIKLGFTFEYSNQGVIYIYTNIFRKGYDRNHQLSHRKIFINDTFYPLVYSFDTTFYAVTQAGFPTWNVSREDPKNKRNDIVTYEKIPSLEERKKLRAVYQRSNNIEHNTPILQIDINGNIVNQ